MTRSFLLALLGTVFLVSGCNHEDTFNHNPPIPFESADENIRQLLLDKSNSLIEILDKIEYLDKGTISGQYYRHGAWPWSYRARTSVLAYKIFGDIDHIVRVLEGSLRYASLPHWNTWQKSTDSWFREITTVGAISIPILDLLILSKSDDRVNELVEDHYSLLLNSIIQRVSGFDETYRRIGKAGYYVTPLDNDRIEATNHMALYAVALARLYELTQEEEYFNRVDQLAQFWIASTMYNAKGNFIWPYEYYHPVFFPFDRARHHYDEAEKYWKAGVTIELPVVAHEIGASVSNDLLMEVRNTLAENMMENGKLKDSIFRIDGEPHKRGRLPKISKFIPTLSSWHLLDCHLPPIENLDSELFRNVDTLDLGNRPLFGAVYGLYARSGRCETGEDLEPTSTTTYN